MELILFSWEAVRSWLDGRLAWQPWAIIVAALMLDGLLGEPRRGHPLVAFGKVATGLERRLPERLRGYWGGCLALVVLVLPVTLPVLMLPREATIAAQWPAVLLLYLCLGGRSLASHARAVGRALERGALPVARRRVGRMVSRDVEELSERQVAAATVESVLENGNDAVVAPLLWFWLGGPAAAVAWRLVNTLDAMWGYRSPRYQRFGFCAARLDDLLGWLPARITCLGYAAAGRCGPALSCWWRQGGRMTSPNAGPVMACGAGALGLRLGGSARYDGQRRHRPALGWGSAPRGADINRALGLLWRALVIWMVLLAAVVWLVRAWG